MSIALPYGLPADQALRQEGLQVVGLESSSSHTSRRLRIGLLNLMPEKVKTEIQFARLLGQAPFDVELSLLVPDGYRPKTTPSSHLERFYLRWSDVRYQSFDGLIVTGAPVETLPFEAVSYWSELERIFDWARLRVTRTFYVCWAAQAALYHFHGVPKHALSHKRFGVFEHQVTRRNAGLMTGIGANFPVPVSRHTEVRAEDLAKVATLNLLAQAPDAGPCLVEDRAGRAHYMFNHLEYDIGTLRDEYLRDRAAGRPINLPQNYFPDDDDARAPVKVWHHAARRLFGNWLAEIDRERAWSLSGPPVVGKGLRRQWNQDGGSHSTAFAEAGGRVSPEVLQAFSRHARLPQRASW